MATDLPDFYRLDGYLGEMFEDCLSRKEAVYGVKIDLAIGRRFGSEMNFFSREDFRQDAVDYASNIFKEMAEDLPMHGSRIKAGLPEGWEKSVLDSDKMVFRIRGKNAILQIGALDIKRVAEIAKDGYVEGLRQDEEGNKILNREEFLTEFRGKYACNLMDGLLYSDAAKLAQAPTEKELAYILKAAGKTYDRYIDIPLGSLMVTKDFIFPYVIGRKKYKDKELRWQSDRYCGYRKESGARMPTADPCVHLTGVDKDCAPHMFENPVFRANFGFPMDIIRDTFVVPRNDENAYVEKAVDSMGDFRTIWVQNPPELPEGVTPSSRHDWFPKKHEFVRVVKELLETEN